MEINHLLLEKAILKGYATKRAIFVSGTTGIGKSCTVKRVAIQLAKKEGREFLEWNKISDKEKLALIEDRVKREKTFLFADVRVSQLDPSDLRGLPKLNGKDYVEWKPTLLFRLLSLDGVKAILFFDEMNLAPPSVQASAYQIILDKAIGEMSINPEVCIIGAGNRAEDRANVFEMSAPLKNRFMHYTLQIPSVDEWGEWALSKGVDVRIVSYLKFKPSYLMADMDKLDDYKSNAFPTPRAWEFCSDTIKDEQDLDLIEMYTSACVGDGVAIEFKAFLKLKEKIDLAKIMSNPEMAKTLPIDLKWSLISAISEKYKSDKKILEKALGVSLNLEPDFGASLLRMMKSINTKDFVNNVIKCKNWVEVSKEFGKFILGD